MLISHDYPPNQIQKARPMAAKIIFDGECNLCNGIVGRLFTQLAGEQTSFIPFQSPEGQHLLAEHGFDLDRLDTVILIDDQGLHLHSTGLLRMLSLSDQWRPLASILLTVPRPLRDSFYKLAAKNRTRLFGSSNQCSIQLSAIDH